MPFGHVTRTSIIELVVRAQTAQREVAESEIGGMERSLVMRYHNRGLRGFGGEIRGRATQKVADRRAPNPGII